jgi:SWI/SNF-related matrix-associated actin-dependent regulator 1 of chromatin subfamily A
MHMRLYAPSASLTQVKSSAQKSVLPRQVSRPHQSVAETFCEIHKRVILADDMGVGKTLPAIRASQGRTIVICPAALKENWRREILRERPYANVLILSGRTPRRIKVAVEFVIVNYDIVEAWCQKLIDWRPETCIADEAHTCRNRKTARFQAALQIVWACDRRYLLTGTPIVNKPLDLVALINMLGKLKNVFGGWWNFVNRYCAACEGEYGLDVSGSSNLVELHEILQRENIMMRRMKAEVLTLPHKTRSISRVTINPADLEEYVRAEQSLIEEIKQNPKLLGDTSFQCLAGVRHAVGQCKIKSAIKRATEILETGQKLVIFAHHRSVRSEIAKAFPDAIMMNAETTDRDACVELFQTSVEHRMFITSPRIGGLGITLTAANIVLIVEFDFTAAVMLQAEDRVHRLGQTRSVIVEYLYADKTVDGFMLALINHKQRIL